MRVLFNDLLAQYQSIKPEIDRAIEDVLQEGRYIGGQTVSSFEEKFAALHQAKYCIGTGNGTDAILIALKALKVKPGDEIITPAFGWLAAAEMITLAGASVVFADVRSDGNIDPSSLESKITDKTVGIVMMHLYGKAAPAHAASEICKKHHLFLIEDCAQAHLTEENSMKVGTIGDVGTFSFYPTKNLGGYGDGGCIVTNNQDLADEMRLYANHGGLHQHLIAGINSRLDPVQAAILSVKINFLHRWTERRIQLAHRYNERLKSVKGLSLPKTEYKSVHTYHQFVIRTKLRDTLKKYLEGHDIQTLVHYPKALHNLPAFRYMGHNATAFPQAAACEAEVLSLPIYPELADDQQEFVCEQIIKFFSAKNESN